jgi:hypothetical protein
MLEIPALVGAGATVAVAVAGWGLQALRSRTARIEGQLEQLFDRVRGHDVRAAVSDEQHRQVLAGIERIERLFERLPCRRDEGCEVPRG